MQTEKIPFVISVTGHRDLCVDELPATREKVESILRYFCELKSLQHTPIWVFSSLADGADRCVAQVALALRETGLYDLRVIAPLPLEHKLYLQDFSADSAEEFEHLLLQMDDAFVLDPYVYDGFDASYLTLPEPDKRNKENNWGYSAERNAQYVNLGAFLVRHANILLALWDGNISDNSAGGTGAVVMAMLNQPMDWGKNRNAEIIPPREELKERQTLMGGESGAVVHIPVTRENTDTSVAILPLQDQRPRWVRHWPGDSIKWYFSCSLYHNEGLTGLIQYSQTELGTIINSINQFNTELSRRTVRRSHEDIEKQLKKTWLQPVTHEFNEAVKRVRRCYRSADWCALNMQIKTKILLQVFFFSVLMAIIGYDAFSRLGVLGNIFGHYSLLFFLTGIFLVSSVFLFSKKFRYKRKFHDFRLYAELMRVSSYLSYLGINRNISEYFTPDTRSLTAWLEHARRVAEYQTWNRAYVQGACAADDMRNIKAWWINDQLAYYAGKLGGDTLNTNKQNLITKYKRIQAISRMLYLVGACVTTYIAYFYFMGEIIVADEIWMNMIFFGSSAVIAKWGDLLGYKDDAARYTLARNMYQWAALEFDDLLKSDDLPRLRGIILELAKQAISENTRWYISQSARDVSINMK